MNRCRDMRQDVGEFRKDIVEFVIERRCIGIRKNVERRIDKVEIEASRDNRVGEEERVHRVETGGVHREGQSFDKCWRQTEFFDISDGAPPTF